jgi:hypothetical protein
MTQDEWRAAVGEYAVRHTLAAVQRLEARMKRAADPTSEAEIPPLPEPPGEPIIKRYYREGEIAFRDLRRGEAIVLKPRGRRTVTDAD